MLPGAFVILDVNKAPDNEESILMSECPCCSGLTYAECCEPVIRGEKNPETPEQVMRARYSAYARTEIDYLEDSTHVDGREDFDKASSRTWSENADWEKLEIVRTQGGGPDDNQGFVEFIARFVQKDIKQKHHEVAEFKKEGDRWFFLDGQPVTPEPYKRETPKVGRNNPCPCGSGKKYKKCCAKG